MGHGWFTDGQTARRHEVALSFAEDRQHLVITGPTLAPITWRLEDLRAVPDETAQSNQMVLTRWQQTDDESPRDPARLTITDGTIIAHLRQTRPGLTRRDLAKGTGRKVLYYTGGAVAAVVLMLFVILPLMADALARLIPRDREVAFGQTVTGQIERFLGATEIGELRCSNPAGEAALQKLLARLQMGNTLNYDISLSVINHGMVNAFAAPGGQVVIMRGLLDKASGPDEVAGVLAHEIGHVEARDPTRHALRAAGSAGILSLVMGDATGSVLVVGLADQVLNSSHSREAERNADSFGLEMLESAQIDAGGLARFFDQIGSLQGDRALPQYLDSHPVTGARAQKTRQFADKQGETSPALSQADWQALKTICDKG